MNPFSCLLFIILVLETFLQGCSSPPENMRILWPPPPKEARLEFVGTYTSQNDFSKSKSEKFLDTISDVYEPAFIAPFGILSDGKGKVFVSDRLRKDITIFDFNKRDISFLGENVSFGRPLGMAMDDAGGIYVADGKRNRVVVFPPNDLPAYFIGDQNTLERPAYIAINNNLGRLYVSDGKSHRIAVFDMNGKHLFFIGSVGSDKGQFFAPQGLAIDHDNNLFVADMLNSRIQVFDADGNFAYSFGRQGSRYWDFENPKDLAFTNDGTLYILDARKALLMAYTPKGKLKYYIGNETRSSHPLAFASPSAIHIDGSDRIYIADQVNKRFSVWQHLTKAYLKKHPITEKELDVLRRRSENVSPTAIE